MAAKRMTTPTPQPAGMPTQSADGVIRRGPGGRFVSKKAMHEAARAAAVEARAGDDAVVVRTTVATGKGSARVPAEAQTRPSATDVAALVPPVQPSLWQRLLGRWRHREEPTAMAAHMAAVKAGVLQELETIGAKKGVALKGSPFATVLLPVRKPKYRWGRWLGGGAALLLVVLLMLWVAQRGDGPQAALQDLGQAVARQDAEAFGRLVDVPAVATGVMNQMFSLPPQDVLAVHAALLARPGMVTALQRDILAAVAGEADAQALPLRLYALMGGDNLRLGRSHVAMQDEQGAVAEVPLIRDDLGLTLPLQVVLERREAAWVVVNVPNLAQVMSALLQAQQAQQAQGAQGVMPVALADEGVQVEALAKPLNSHTTLLLRARVANRSAQPLADAKLEVQFGDAAQRPLYALSLPLEGGLKAYEVRDQVWRVPVDTRQRHAATVARLPLGAMHVTATVVYE